MYEFVDKNKKKPLAFSKTGKIDIDVLEFKKKNGILCLSLYR
jgi:hypothetical protein